MKLLRALLILAAMCLIVWLLAVWAPAAASSDTGTTTDASTTAAATVTVTTVIQAPTPPPIVFGYAGHPARYWHDALIAKELQLRRLRRTLLRKPTVVEALNLACVVYGDCATLWRRARCESRLDPGAVHHSRRYLLSADNAAGLLQFKPSTWRTTPFAHFSIFSPIAQALAAGWMIDHGRGGEWDCR